MMTWSEKMRVGMALMSEACFESEDEERYPLRPLPRNSLLRYSPRGSRGKKLASHLPLG